MTPAAFSAGGIAHIAKLLDYQETKRDIWLVMDRGRGREMMGRRLGWGISVALKTTHLRD